MTGESRACRKCGECKPLAKFVNRTKGSGRIAVGHMCMACRGKSECARLKLEMLDAFGWKCMCCGEDKIYFLTLQHIHGGRHFYGRKDKVTAGRVQSSTYVEIRKARKSGWDRTQYELLCINCNFAHGHHGECPHRSGVTNEQIIASLRQAAAGIGKEQSVKNMVETGKATRYHTGNPRPDMVGNKNFPKHRGSHGQFISEKVN